MSKEYFIEFRHAGNAVKVSAIDPVTGTEVSIVGDPHRTEAELSRLAVQKLEYILKKNAPK
ncbi:MAG: hypothetical protein H6908_06200 [Hyphomicrobiales bacterium]|nr:hypothetical protein [Rickettsiales bacterium]MCP5362204.1 hypothetical protein [Hyphomicrobiales bacterium]